MIDPRRTLSILLFAASLSPLACSGDHDEPYATNAADHHDDADDADDHATGTVSSPLAASDTVATAVAQSCTTASVKALAVQLVEQIQCLRPNTFAKIDNTPGLALGSAVFPYLQTKAAQGLIAAQKARGTTMSINSALRTLPQQYLLYRWYQTGRCGIGLAASPGTSNHEGAIAVDINDNAGWRASMLGKGFRWLGASDPVHYDFTAGGTVDLRGLSVKAFQRLWNRNHPDDTIAEDGAYGGATATRLAQSPVGGFPKGADCSKPATDAGTATDAGDDPSSTSPADVPAIPDATEGDDDARSTTSTSSGPQTRPTPEATGCSAVPAATHARDTSPAAPALALAAALAVAARRRRRLRLVP
ncbi:MAG: N-acetylmuramoyl-L-alanine amidase [Labilithrix sp.]|nr:N-acetylmuramoyl-L-alanine amidase [Labilithrix sp.]